ncbi:MAG: acetyl-CoA carboxylase carboxyl transferase subunit alpha, partial [Aeromonadaceae bacterium]
MNLNFLEFEQPIAELLAQIEELKHVGDGVGNRVDLSEEIGRLEKKNEELTRKLFADLGAWQISQVARHPMRPYTQDYIDRLFTDFDELAGDRAFADDKAIIGGIARFEGEPVMVIGQQKGRDTQEKIRRNFGMPRPEGYRKALRLMQMAERFKMPIITFIDTPGAYPGIGAEERGQSEAIARNLKVMSSLKVPVVCTVIGEGGSGGALAIGVGDRVNMLQYSTYSVISPEGCASILWKSADKASLAAEAMGITAARLKQLKLINHVVPEPLGGAHRNYDEMAALLRKRLLADLSELRR